VAVEDLGYVCIKILNDLTRLTGFQQNVDIGPGPNRHTWGCALLSKVSHDNLIAFACNSCRRTSFP